MHSLFLAEEERILGEIKRERWSQTEKDGEKGSLLSDQRAKGGIRERRELWTGRQEREREKEEESRRGTHRGRTLARGAATCCASFLPFFFRRHREERKEKERRREKNKKTHFPSGPMGALKPAVPHIAALI